METLETSGATVEEAVDLALKTLGVGRDDVEIVVVSKGRQGVLGIGAEPAIVRVEPKNSDLALMAQELLEGLLLKMGVSSSVHLREAQGGNQPQDVPPIVFDVEGDDSGMIIGRRGETLAALQFITNSMLYRQTSGSVRVIVDAEGYKARRQEAVKNVALDMAERVGNTGRSASLEPMSPAERRVVHMTLADHARVTTESSGFGDNRRVTVSPKGR